MEGPAPTSILAASRPQPTGGQTLGVRRFLHSEERQLAIRGRASSHGDSRVFPCTANVRSGRTARPAGHHPSVRVAFRHPVTGEQSPRRLPEEDRGQMGPQTPGHHRRLAFVDPRLGREPVQDLRREVVPRARAAALDQEGRVLPGQPAAAGLRRRPPQGCRPVRRTAVGGDSGRSIPSTRPCQRSTSTPRWPGIPVSRIGKGTVNLPSKGLDTRVFLTLDQLEDLLALVPMKMPYWYPMIKLVAETGLRRGEAAGLPADNLDLARRSVSSSSASSSTAAATGPSGYRRASAGAGSDSTRTPWRSFRRT